jgi:hypothetical protein
MAKPQWQYQQPLKTQNSHQFPRRSKNLVTSREKALAAHKLAQRHMAERIKSNFVLFKKGQMVWLDSRQTITRRWLQNKKDHSKLRRYWDWLLTN